jgi:hypothetical protein
MKSVVKPMKFGQANHLTSFNPACHVDHRNGAGHLDATYEADLRMRAHDSAQKASERAFVSGTWSTDPGAEEAAEEFVRTVTSGADGGAHVLYEESAAENGFLETDARAEFLYGMIASFRAIGTPGAR